MKKSYDFLKVPFLIVLVLLPFEGFEILSFADIHLSLPFFLIVITAFVSVLRIILKGRFSADLSTLLAILILIFGFTSVFSGFIEGSSKLELFKSFFLILILVLYFIGISQVRFTLGGIVLILKLLVLSGVVWSLVGIYQALANNTSLPDLFFNLTNPITGTQRISYFGSYIRPTSIFTEPSWFGHYLILSLASLVGVYKKMNKASFYFCLLSLISGIISTLSFGSYLLLIILLFFTANLLLLRKRRRKLLTKPKKNNRNLLKGIYFLFGIVIIIFLIKITLYPLQMIYQEIELRMNIVFSALKHYFLSPEPFVVYDSVSMRLSLSYAGIMIWLNSPLTLFFGVGLGNFFYGAKKFLGVSFGYSGTGWTNILAEQGLLGFMSYFLFFISYIFKFRKLIKQDESKVDTYYISRSLYLLTVMLFFSAFTGGFGFERSITIWSMFVVLEVAYNALKVF